MMVKELWDAYAFPQPVAYKFRCKISHLVGQQCRVGKLDAFQGMVAALLVFVRWHFRDPGINGPVLVNPHHHTLATTATLTRFHIAASSWACAKRVDLARGKHNERKSKPH